MFYFKEIKEELDKFENLGYEVSELGTKLIGKALHSAPMAWIHSIYKTIDSDDINILEKDLKIIIPDSYKDFLMNCSNGLTLFTSTFNLDGYRKVLGRGIEASRQPYSILIPNLDERPENSKPNYFFIGSYEWDGSKLYIDTKTNKVHYCEMNDSTSLYQWNSFEDMLLAETKRIIKLFDEKGVIINENKPTTPIV